MILYSFYDPKVSGRLILVLDDGSETELSVPGTVCIQRGSNHQWLNRTNDWAQFAAVVLDAKPVEVVSQDGSVKKLVEERLSNTAPILK